MDMKNSLMAHIRRIREKIEENPSKPVSLITVKGLGYKTDGKGVGNEQYYKTDPEILFYFDHFDCPRNSAESGISDSRNLESGKDSSGWQQAEEVAAALSLSEGGSYVLSEEGEKVLEQTGAWGILVENDTGNVIWSSTGLPREIPTHYTLGEISWAVRGYIRDYPTTVSPKGG